MHLQKPNVKATVSKLTGLHINLDVSRRMAKLKISNKCQLPSDLLELMMIIYIKRKNIEMMKL